MRVLALIAVIGLAGCGSKPAATTQNRSDFNASAVVAEPATNMVAPIPSPTPTSTSTPAASTSLSGYVGKYPFDKVNGTSFLDLPAVRTAVAGAVSDAKIRAWIFDKAGPQTPIAMVDGKLAAWGCEAHNCGPHQWTVLIAPDGGDAEVCYLPDGAAKADWYAHGAKEARTDACPSGG